MICIMFNVWWFSLVITSRRCFCNPFIKYILVLVLILEPQDNYMSYSCAYNGICWKKSKMSPTIESIDDCWGILDLNTTKVSRFFSLETYYFSLVLKFSIDYFFIVLHWYCCWSSWDHFPTILRSQRLILGFYLLMS